MARIHLGNIKWTADILKEVVATWFAENPPNIGDFMDAGEVSSVINDSVTAYLQENPPADGRNGVDGDDGVDGEDGEDGHTPIFSWIDTTLLIDGVAGPNLAGPAGVDGKPGTPGEKGDPGNIGNAILYGEGRPDIPATLSIDVSAAVVGAIFVSTDQHSGAITWLKTSTSWIVLTGDTGWRRISNGSASSVLGEGYKLDIRRVDRLVEMRFTAHQNPSAMPNYQYPSGFRNHPDRIQRAMYRPGTQNITGYFNTGNGYLTYNGSLNIVNASAAEIWTTSDPWPTTLPGTKL